MSRKKLFGKTGKEKDNYQLFEAVSVAHQQLVYARPPQEKSGNPQELVSQYKLALHWIEFAAEQGATIVLQGVHDGSTTWTLHGNNSVVDGNPDSCWKILSSTMPDLWLPDLSPKAMEILALEQKQHEQDKRFFAGQQRLRTRR